MKISNFNDDLLELQDFANRLESFIKTEHEFVEGSLVLALASKYGSGKTTFLDMWKSSLEQKNDTGNNLLVVSLNAWESDYYGDPLFAIVSALIECLKDEGDSPATLVNAAKNLGWFATAIGGQIVNKLSGIDLVAAGGFAESKEELRKDANEVLPDTFTMYEHRKAAMQTLKNALRETVSAYEPYVIFLVDELDRCRPDYAITYLETIKHIFDIKGAVFLLAADRRHLENSARTAFGADLDFEEYFRKFVHREITLPQISEVNYKKLAAKYARHYLENDGNRICFMPLDNDRIENTSELIGALKLTPRQIQEVFRILGHILSTSETKKGKLLFGLAVGSIVMAALRIGNPKIYHLLGSRQLTCEEASKYFRALIINKSSADWWLMLLLSGSGLVVKNDEDFKASAERTGIEKDSWLLEHGRSSQVWGIHGQGRIGEVYRKIEEISKWN